MERSKIIAVITGVISIALAIAYLLLVQLLDMRGEMLPAPTGDVGTILTRYYWQADLLNEFLR